MQSASSWALDDARRYFRGERAQGWVWLAVGLGLGGAGAIGLASDATYRAGGWPLVSVGALQVAAGLWLVFTSGRRAEAINSWNVERVRIGRVVRTFAILEIIELVVVVAGVVVAVTQRGDLRWIGGGLAIQGLAMFGLDRFAHRRARSYRGSLDGIGAQRAAMEDLR